LHRFLLASAKVAIVSRLAVRRAPAGRKNRERFRAFPAIKGAKEYVCLPAKRVKAASIALDEPLSRFAASV